MIRHKNLLIYEHMVAVDCGDGAQMTIANAANDDTHIEWQLRHASPETVVARRMTAASLLESYDYLLREDVPDYEAIHRLRLLREARAETLKQNTKE